MADDCLSFKDEDGTVLRGFSQVDLDELNNTLTKVYRLIKVFGFSVLMIIIWLLWQAKKYKFFTYMFR